MHLPHIAVIVTTYNRPGMLEAVQDSLERQSYRDGRFATTVLHLWHPHRRHRGTRENLARLRALGESAAVRAVQGVDQYLS